MLLKILYYTLEFTNPSASVSKCSFNLHIWVW